MHKPKNQDKEPSIPKYSPFDESGRHFLDLVQDYEYTDTSIVIEATLNREGVSAKVTGRSPEDIAVALEHVYLLTRHIPGYCINPETGLAKYKPEQIRKAPTATHYTQKDYAKIERIHQARKAKANQQ